LSLLDLTVREMGERLRQGSLTAAALTRAHFERIDALDPAIHAFTALSRDAAYGRAEQADADLQRGVDRGPLHGIPVAVKDLINFEGMPTGCGSRLRISHVAQDHAHVIRRLLDAGGVLLGKLATYEFALVGPSFDQPAPPAANPWAVDRITGGSSSGSAAAVAARLVRTTIGTDTGGSIRSPAGYCGIVGLKPTFGRVSRRGVFPLSPSLDHVGPLSATVSEAALTLDAIGGYDEGDPASASLEARPASGQIGQSIDGLRIGYAREWFARDPDLMPEVLRAMDDAVSQLSLLGARIEEVALPDYGLMEAVGAIILHAEALELHLEALRARGAEYGRQAYRSLAGGVGLTSEDCARAQKAARTLRDEIDQTVLTRCAAIVTANTLSTAPLVEPFRNGNPVWTAMRTLPFNVTGHPSLALPVGFAKGLPIGMQIVGRAFDEATLCRIGDAFERATDHSVLRPATASVPERAGEP
jgi:aspartyl-tRNA(Asn)/glutamyl-tRNA(Gln) amidotransferase subunit A